MNKSCQSVIAAAIASGLVCLLVYLPSLSNGFINLDDPFYITNNPLIKNLDFGSIRRIFTGSHLAAWLPLTYLSFAVDYHFWGDNPYGYHLTNIILHGVNAGLVVLLAAPFIKHGWSRIGDGRGYPAYLSFGLLLFAGLLFGLHPLRVESVAWAAERKDVLNGLFTLLALLAYLRYARLKEEGAGLGSCLSAYLPAVVFFILSLLAKQVSVTLPVILLLLDWYPLQRLRRERIMALLLEKIPFFLVSLLITWATLHFAVAEKKLISMASMPFWVRGLVSGNAVFEYCRMSLFPLGISPYFVLPKPLPYSYPVNTVVVLVVSLLLLRYAGRLRGGAVAWFAFVIALSPMLAFLQSGDDIALATRYTYLPAIALTIGLAAVIAQQLGRWFASGKRLLPVTGLVLMGISLAALTGITMKLIPVWHDTGTFWSRVIEVKPVGRAYGDRGVYYLINGRSGAALEDFNAAIEIAATANNGILHNLYAFRGVAMSDGGRFAEAIADFNQAIAIFPHPTYFHLRGTALQAMGRSVEAEADFRRAGANPPPIDWFEQK